MNLFQLILKQMRQRALGTTLTLLSVMLGTALAVAILVFRQGGESLFAQTDFGYDVIVGTNRGAEERLVLNSIYHIGRSPGPLPYYVFEQLDSKRRPPPGTEAFNFPQHVRLAVPFALGDTYRGRPIIGTLPRMFGVNDVGEPIDPGPNPDELPGGIFQYRTGKRFELAEGRVFYERLVDRSKQQPAPAAAAAATTQPTAAATQPAGLLASASGELTAPAAPPLAAGPRWEAKFEAVIGADVAKTLGLKIGDKFRAIHGESSEDDDPDHHHHHDHGHAGDDKKAGGPTLDVHKEQWEVVGILKPTGTAADRALYIPLTTFYCIPKHEEGLDAHTRVRMGQVAATGKTGGGHEEVPYEIRSDGTVDLQVPMGRWELSGIFVKCRGSNQAQNLVYHINNGLIPEALAAHPGPVMRGFFDTFLRPSATLLLMIAVLVSVVAGVGILVSIYNSVSARNKEIAVLRALGATRARVLLLICAEAGLIGLAGAALGFVAGHLLGAVGSSMMASHLGQGFNWMSVTAWEAYYLVGVVVGAVVAGLVPAIKAYATPVATNLVAS